MKKSSINLYILDGREVIPAKDVFEWADFFEVHSKRLIKQTDVKAFGRDYCMVSTVFLGIDHSFMEDGPPLVFETMVFGGVFDGHEVRYYTYTGAEEGHAFMVDRVKNPGAMLQEILHKARWKIGWKLRRLRGRF